MNVSTRSMYLFALQVNPSVYPPLPCERNLSKSADRGLANTALILNILFIESKVIIVP